MRRRLQRLEALGRLARDRERQAARALAEARREAAGARRRLEELQGYLAEYRGRGPGAAPGAVLTAAALGNHSRFLAGLGQAVALQRQEVERREAEAEGRRRAWEEARAELRRLEKALERTREALGREEARRERRLEDELAARWTGRR